MHAASPGRHEGRAAGLGADAEDAAHASLATGRSVPSGRAMRPDPAQRRHVELVIACGMANDESEDLLGRQRHGHVDVDDVPCRAQLAAGPRLGGLGGGRDREVHDVTHRRA